MLRKTRNKRIAEGATAKPKGRALHKHKGAVKPETQGASDPTQDVDAKAKALDALGVRLLVKAEGAGQWRDAITGASGSMSELAERWRKEDATEQA